MSLLTRSLVALSLLSLTVPGARAWNEEPPAVQLVDVITTATLPVSRDFHAVSIGGFGSLHIVQGPETKLTVTTDVGYLGRVKANVDDGFLRLGNVYAEDGLRPELHFELTVPTLDRISVGGGGRISVGAFVAEELTINASGGARVDCFALGAVHAVLKVSGGARLEFSKLAVDDLEVFGNGGGFVLVTDGYWNREEHVTLNGGAAFRTGEDHH